jgi:FkbM family methyltransferase
MVISWLIMKNLVKGVTPPFIYEWSRKILAKPRVFKPIWNTLQYEPVKGVKMYFDPTGPWQQKFISSEYDNYLFNRLKTLDMSGKTIFDIGAHIGFHSFYFARLVGPKGKVYAFEPHPKNLERIELELKQNKDLESIITVFNVALSDKEGTEVFNLNNDVESGRSSGGFIESADTVWDKSAYIERGFQKMTIPTLPLDKMSKIGINRKPDVLKIDVEGAEAFVLYGAKETIIKYKPLILLEVHSTKAMFDVMNFFNKLHYEIQIIHKENDGRFFLEAK